MKKQLFTPIQQEKLSVKIINQIKTLIMKGELKPGDPLPPERELMKLLNVSRPSIREALKSLIGMGLLETTQGNRTVVKSLASGRMIEPFHHLLKDDFNIVFELIEVRKAIEAWNAYYAAKRATSQDILRLEENIESMRIHLEANIVRMEKEDADFHLAISEATHNKVQTHIMFTIYDILKSSIGKYYNDIDHREIYKQHLNVVNAIKKGDSELAREKILEHLDYVESRIKEIVAPETRKTVEI
ncbi:MAG: FadR family transcriptional regulator [Deltaproteobacteria bacterium]|nr:FadR family transcriptional regulator [Deltaproteobacteria bacterium]MBW1960626.1 FadR family transcriptional regulator [Deltaproteobacteria bacterium]MBW2150632.1 FadR family transcriptional regulator [Deltaproteobacteria bacterium]